MSDFQIKALNEQRLTVAAQSKAILDNADADKRALTADESVAFEKATAEMIAIGERAKSIIENEKRNADMADLFGKHVPAASAAKVNSDEAGLRTFLRDLPREGWTVPAQRANFGIPEQRDLVKGTTTAGGFLVPTTLYKSLIEYAVDSSGVLAAGPTILQTAGGENIDIPYVTAYGSAVLTAEAAAIAESDPAFAKRTLGAYKYAQLVQISRELIQDEVFDIEGFVARVAGRNIGLAFGVDLAVGNGSSKPSGIVQTATLGVTGGAGVAGAFTADNLIDLQMSVLPAYRNSPSAAWLVKDATLGGIRKLKDGAGRYLFEPAQSVGAPDSLLGKKIVTDPNIAAVALSAKSVLFGDISQYYVRLAGGVRFERSDEFAFNTDLVTFKAVLRGDGVLADQTGAVKYFVGNAA